VSGRACVETQHYRSRKGPENPLSAFSTMSKVEEQDRTDTCAAGSGDGDGLHHAVPCPQHASYLSHTGNKVVPLVDGHVAFSRIHEAIRLAKHSVYAVIGFVDLNTRLPSPPSVPQPTVFEMLDAAASRGLDVRVLFWGASEHFGMVFKRTKENYALYGMWSCYVVVMSNPASHDALWRV